MIEPFIKVIVKAIFPSAIEKGLRRAILFLRRRRKPTENAAQRVRKVFGFTLDIFPGKVARRFYIIEPGVKARTYQHKFRACRGHGSVTLWTGLLLMK
jgi:hypothetical protein